METITLEKKLVYTPSEVMEIFSISRPTFGDWCKKGVLRKIQIRGQRRVYVSADDVEKLIAGKS
jgi:predicted site-specific integrase-resolvase